MIKEIVIISGKGGTGKTSLAASFAVLADRPVIADCDVDAADLHLLLSPQVRERHDFWSGHQAVIRQDDCTGCGACLDDCRFGAVKKIRSPAGEAIYSIDPISCEGCGVCVRFCPAKAISFGERLCGEWMVSETRCGPMVHAHLDSGAENSGKLVSAVRREARSIAEKAGHSLVIVDGPPGIGCPVIASVTGATHVLAVTEPTVSGEHDVERVLTLTKHFGIPTAICVNKWDINVEMTKRIEEAACKSGARVAGRLRYDRGVTAAQMEERAVVETTSPVAEDVRQIWGNLFPEEGSMDQTHHQGCPVPKHSEDRAEAESRERQEIESRLGRIGHKILVLSGKGGVGKSTVAVNLATALMMAGKRVGLLDVDIHGPSIPTMLGIERATVEGKDGEMLPVDVGGLKVMSMGFFLRSQDDAVIWRGPLKMSVIKQFLKDVAWGDLDFLVIDSPPGTGDEPLSVCQLAGKLDGAVVVTTPQKVAAVDVRKSISFCRRLMVPVLGVVENVSGFACPRCGEVTPILRSGGGVRIAEDMGVPFLGSIPMDPQIAEACDSGQSFIQRCPASPTAKIMQEIIKPIVALSTG